MLLPLYQHILRSLSLDFSGTKTIVWFHHEQASRSMVRSEVNTADCSSVAEVFKQIPLHRQMYIAPLGNLHCKLCTTGCGISFTNVTGSRATCNHLGRKYRNLERNFNFKKPNHHVNDLEQKYLRIHRICHTKIRQHCKNYIYLQFSCMFRSWAYFREKTVYLASRDVIIKLNSDCLPGLFSKVDRNTFTVCSSISQTCR